MADLKRVISIQTEIDRGTITKSEKEIDNFLNKYNDKKIKVNTSDFSVAAQQIKSLGDEIRKIESDSSKKHLLPTIAQDKQYLADLKAEFKDVAAVFTDGSITKGFENTFSKIFSGAQIAAIDLGEYVDTLYAKVESLQTRLSDIRESKQARYTDEYSIIGDLSYSLGKFGGVLDAGQLSEQKQILAEIVTSMQQINQFKPDTYSKGDINSLTRVANNTEYAIRQMQEYNLATTEQLVLRERLQDLAREDSYGSSDLNSAKSHITEDKDAYEAEIQTLNEYIERKQEVISLLQEHESTLFNWDASAEIDRAQQNIDRYKVAITELGEYYDKVWNNGGGKNDLTPITNSLNELKEVISSIKSSLDPISELFKNENNAMQQMAQNGVSSFTSLSEAVNALYNNLLNVESAVNNISQKDFNLTHLTQSIVQPKDQTVDLIRSYRDAANSLYDQIPSMIMELYNNRDKVQNNEIREKIGQSVGELYRFDDIVSKNDLRASSLSKIQEVYDKLSKYKQGILQLIQDINNATSGTITKTWEDISDPKAIMEKAASESKQLEQENESVANSGEKVASTVEGIEALTAALKDVVGALEPINNALTTSGTLFNQMATSGALSLDTLITKLQEASNLAKEIVNGAGTVVGTDGIQAATDAITQEGNAAESAATQKEKFVTANETAAQSGYQTAEGAKAAAIGMQTEAEAAQASANALNKRSKTYIGDEEDPSKIIEQATQVTKNAYQTITETYMRNGEGGYDLVTTQVVDDFKKMEEAGQKAEQAALKAVKAQDAYIAQKNKNISNLSSVLDSNANRNLVGTQYENEARAKIKAIEDEVAKLDATLADGSRVIFSEEELNAEKKKIEELVREAGDYIKTSRNAEYAPIAFDSQRVSGNLQERQNTLSLFINNLRQAGVLTGELEEDTNKLSESLSQVQTNGDLKNYLYQLKEVQSKAKLMIQQKKEEDAMWAEYNKGYTEEDIKRQTDESWAEYAKQNAAAAKEEAAAQKELAQAKKEADAYYKQEAKLSTDKQTQESALNKQIALWEKNGQLTDEVRVKIDELSKSLSKITTPEQLTEWKAQLAQLRNEVTQTKYELDAVTKVNKQNLNYGKSTFNGATRKYDNTMAAYANLDDGAFSPALISAMDTYIQKYNELSEARQRFANDPALANNQDEKNAFHQTAQSVEEARKKVEEYLNSVSKLQQAENEGTLIDKNTFDPNGIQQANAAIKEYANSLFKGKLQVTGWNAAGTEMYGTLDKGKGVIENVTVALERGTNALFAYKTGTKEVGTAWDQLKAGVSKKASEIASYIVGAGSIYKGIAEVQKGIQYVKEIDSALTELKKVTDETDATYAKFLQTMSQTGGAIGATVSDLTNMAADWARLGSIIKSAPLCSNT